MEADGRWEGGRVWGGQAVVVSRCPFQPVHVARQPLQPNSMHGMGLALLSHLPSPIK